MPDETVDVVFVNHTKDHAPGDRASFPAEQARQLVKGAAAVYATKTAAKDAGDPEGPTPRSS